MGSAPFAERLYALVRSRAVGPSPDTKIANRGEIVQFNCPFPP